MVYVTPHIANLCHLANASYRAGKRLAIDAGRGRFTGDDPANTFLTRVYRDDYVVSRLVSRR
jgi:hypothetical protein